MKYFSEIQMSTHFQKIFFNSFKNESFKILKELEGVTGRPDFFFIFKENDCLISTISIELKLRDWKKALSQAFKYRFYSNQAIVILDSNYSEPAIKNLDKFKKFNVGLCSLNKKDCKLIIHYVPNLTIPLSKYHLSTLFSALEKRKVNLDSTVIINNEYAKQFKIKKFLLTFLNNLKKNNNVILATV